MCIEQRPSIVDKKSHIGDFEGDTVSGKNHQGFIVTLVDRKSRYTLATQVNSKQALTEAEAIISMLPPHKQVYFAQPYCSWERGLNENTNGLLRQCLPKGTYLRSVTQSQVDAAVFALKHRPRKCLGNKTPHEMFYGLPLKPIKPPSDALCI